MNCEHGIDIDEYDCHKCNDYMKKYWEKENNNIAICKAILLKHGFHSEIKNVWKVEDIKK